MKRKVKKVKKKKKDNEKEKVIIQDSLLDFTKLYKNSTNLKELYTRKRQVLFLKCYLYNGGKITDACNGAGISRQIYYYWLKNDEDFKDRMLDAELIPNEMMESSIFRQGLAGEFNQQKLWMQNKAGWSDKKEIDVKGESKNIHVYLTKEQYDEELKKLDDEEKEILQLKMVNSKKRISLQKKK